MFEDEPGELDTRADPELGEGVPEAATCLLVAPPMTRGSSRVVAAELVGHPQLQGEWPSEDLAWPLARPWEELPPVRATRVE